jgi:site-specific DNA recombinase
MRFATPNLLEVSFQARPVVERFVRGRAELRMKVNNMSERFSSNSAANQALMGKAQQWWLDAASRHNVNLEGFDPEASYSDRIKWALTSSMIVATIYTRFSTKMQHSTEDQVRESIACAARNGMYVPPELISVDEGVKGRRTRRDGLERMKQILGSKDASVLLVYSVSRLSRHGYKGYQFIQEEVVDEGLRAVSVSQGIDTNDGKTWKLALQMHGVMDEALLDGIAESVRAGLIGRHLNGWTTGAIGVGYRPKILPNAPVTKRGLPRTAPEIDPDVAKMIQTHARLHLDGMPVRKGWLRWVANGGAHDPRSTVGQMSLIAYRRLLSNVRLIGQWDYGRMRNQFSSKLDYVRQVKQPDSEVSTFQCEELRILDDATFYAIQSMLASNKQGPRGPRKKGEVQLWNLTTKMFHCAHCSTPEAPVRYYQCGANGEGMQCKHGDLCSFKSAVRRKEAVCAICDKLAEQIQRDSQLVAETIGRACELDTEVDDDLSKQIASAESSIRTLTRRIEGLYELIGDGSDDDRKEMQAQIRAAQAERASAQSKVAKLKNSLDRSATALTPDDVSKILSDTSTLLQDAAAGTLGEDAVYKALSVFRTLTGGHISCHIERRSNRKRTNVRGVFTVNLVRAVHDEGVVSGSSESFSNEVSVWLREPPQLDAMAERVHELVDNQGLTFADAAVRLQADGLNVNDTNVWYSYRRWYEMQALPVPKRPYNNGRPRKSP